jgi:hypothetical protein
MSALGQKRSFVADLPMSALRQKRSFGLQSEDKSSRDACMNEGGRRLPMQPG